MSLITPDFGLLVWMTLIFGIVFFILAKFGFPMITESVEKRAERIENSITAAKEAEKQLQSLAEEHNRLVEDARKERNEILKKAESTREQLIQKAKTDAEEEAGKILAKAKVEIAAEKESALRSVRHEMAELSLGIAEKVIRKNLGSDQAQAQYVERLIEEISDEK